MLTILPPSRGRASHSRIQLTSKRRSQTPGAGFERRPRSSARRQFVVAAIARGASHHELGRARRQQHEAGHEQRHRTTPLSGANGSASIAAQPCRRWDQSAAPLVFARLVYARLVFARRSAAPSCCARTPEEDTPITFRGRGGGSGSHGGQARAAGPRRSFILRCNWTSIEAGAESGQVGA
jgi:hypothetical protein